MYKIYGDYGYTTETLLEEFDTRSEALRWADRYVESGDFGGYSTIEIAFFAEDGEYVPVMVYRAEDYEDETVFYEGDDDFALIDDF
jgi:hypothetical protein